MKIGRLWAAAVTQVDRFQPQVLGFARKFRLEAAVLRVFKVLLLKGLGLGFGLGVSDSLNFKLSRFESRASGFALSRPLGGWPKKGIRGFQQTKNKQERPPGLQKPKS